MQGVVRAQRDPTRTTWVLGCDTYQVPNYWAGKHKNILMEPTNSPTQGQPNPTTIRLKVAIGPLFPTANDFSWIGIGFI